MPQNINLLPEKIIEKQFRARHSAHKWYKILALGMILFVLTALLAILTWYYKSAKKETDTLLSHQYEQLQNLDAVWGEVLIANDNARRVNPEIYARDNVSKMWQLIHESLGETRFLDLFQVEQNVFNLQIATAELVTGMEFVQRLQTGLPEAILNVKTVDTTNEFILEIVLTFPAVK